MGRRSWRLAPALLMAATAGMLFAIVSSQKPSVLNRGSSLSVERFADDVLISEGGTFKVGFYPVGENAFAFAVWFTEPANGTVVWMANRDRPVNGRESRLEFGRSGQVALIDADGSIVWATNTSDVDGVVAEQMEIGEDGNLVVRDSLGKALWESFDFPTDTLLAFQGMTRSKKLVSRRAADDYSSGPYQFLFDDDNVLSFLYEGSDLSSIYWPNPDVSIFANGRTRYNSTKYASFDDLGRFTSSDNLMFSASDVGLKNKRRLTMDHDGVLRLYSLNSTTKSWEVTWLPVLERCRVHGLCGENGICFYNPEPECTCPPGFSMKNRTDWTQGCQPNSKIVCNDSRVQIVKLPHTDFYGYDLSTYTPGVSFEACKNICTSDCKCRGFGYRLDQGSGSCYPKNILFNGQTGPNVLMDIYIKVSSVGNFNNYLEGQFHTDCSLANLSIIRAGVFSSGNVHDYLKLPVGFVIAIGIVEIICLVFGWAYLHKELGHIHNIDQGYTALRSGFKRFTYKELKRATKNFSSEIGRGGSGVVYKGVLEGEVVAIKRLDDVHHGEAQFWSEVSIIGRINHINLLRLLGFCFEKQSKLLVYEYMENGSLEKNLFNSSSTLAWDNRFNIALGTAKGLAYLHEECLEWVLHCDIKPQNILLDKDFTPKVADFGLSKLLDRGGTNVSSFSRVRGTRGYMAPEWILNQPITSKVDVYSYGVLVLEMVTGRSSVGFQQVDDNGEIRSAQLIPWVREMVGTRQQWIQEIADPSLSGIYDKLKMEVLVKVALKCVEEERDARPTMSQVVDAITLGCQ